MKTIALSSKRGTKKGKVGNCDQVGQTWNSLEWLKNDLEVRGKEEGISWMHLVENRLDFPVLSFEF